MKTCQLLNTVLAIATLIVVSGCVTSQTNHAKALAKNTQGTTTGRITSISVSGYGQNSAEIVFTVLSSATGQNQAFHVLAYPAYEPQVFSSTATMLTTAYVHNKKVRVTYQRNEGETDRTISVSMPAN